MKFVWRILITAIMRGAKSAFAGKNNEREC